MIERTVGSSDLRVSFVGLGCNGLGGRVESGEAHNIVRGALDLGITMFDTADYYGRRGGSEEALGKALGAQRKNVVIATKFGLPMDETGLSQGASARYVKQAVEASLRRLKTDWIDLYQLHVVDRNTPIDETLSALDELVREGKVRYAGCSNIPGTLLSEARRAADQRGFTGFVSGQYEYNLLARDIERELLPAMERDRLGLLPYFPLACGLLTGRYRRQENVPTGSRLLARPEIAERYMQPATWLVLDKLAAHAAQTGRSMLEIAWGWLGSRSAVASVIAGSTSVAQLASNVRSATAGLRLSPGEIGAIDEITTPIRN